MSDKWPGHEAQSSEVSTAHIKSAPLDAYTGYFDDGNGYLLELVTHQGNLAVISDGFVDSILRPSGEHSFSAIKEDLTVQFSLNANGEVIEGKTSFNKEGKVIKISPLLTSIPAQEDSNPTRTSQVAEALSELARVGAKDSKTAWIAAATKKVFTRPMRELNGFKKLQFIKETPLENFRLSRHKSKAKTLLAYKLNAEMPAPFIFVFLNDAGQLIDFDLVKN